MTTKELYAVFADGEDSFAAIYTKTGWLPLVFADMKTLDLARPAVKNMAYELGKRFKIMKFSAAEEIETIE